VTPRSARDACQRSSAAFAVAVKPYLYRPDPMDPGTGSRPGLMMASLA
jgi:hypothetical protein